MSAKKVKAFTLSDKVIKAIEKEAKKQNRSMSNVVDMVLSESLKA